MSYGGYQGGSGYGQSNPYGQANPYEQQNPYGAHGGYNSAPAPQNNYSGGNRYGNNDPYAQQEESYRPSNEVELQSLVHGKQDVGYNAPSSNPDQILNDCREIDRAIEDLERSLEQLKTLHRRRLNAAETDNSTTQAIDRLQTDIMTTYRGLVERMRKLKGLKDSGNPRNAPQIGRADRRLKAAINSYQTAERDFRHGLQEQQARQYRIVRPDATEEEVQEAVEDPNAQIFQQALLNSDRRGQAQRTLGAVNARHAEIQKIERQMIELAQLFTDLENIVVQQEPLVQNIEQKGEEVNDNIVKANVELGGAVNYARAARRKKWICLGICVAIVVLIIVIVLIYLGVTGRLGGKSNNNNNNNNNNN